MNARLVSFGVLLASAITPMSACAPITFSQEPSVDFATYPSVRVEMAGPDGSEQQLDYLLAELSDHSGFTTITADTAGTVSAVLLVELDVLASDDGVLFSNIDEAPTYSGNLTYRLQAASGVTIEADALTVSDETTYDDAAEGAIDQLVLHYLRPYRL